MVSDLSSKYIELNNSFRRTLYINLNNRQGFYSEFNSLLLAMLYALQYKYRLVLCSKDSPFFANQGMSKFFVPVIPETKNHLLNKIVRRELENGITSKLGSIYKLFNQNIYSSDIFWFTHSNWFANMKFSIPELGINGDIKDAMRILIPLIYNFNPSYRQKIDDYRKTIKIDGSYVGFHVRCGDKRTEREIIEPQKYIELVKEKTSIRQGFVFTDDYEAFEILKKTYPEWTLYTSCMPSESGYSNASFSNENESTKEKELIKMFASIDILLKSDIFVGSFSSNPGLFIALQKKDCNMIGVDFDKWLLI